MISGHRYLSHGTGEKKKKKCLQSRPADNLLQCEKGLWVFEALTVKPDREGINKIEFKKYFFFTKT